MVAELVNRKNGKEQKNYSSPIPALKNVEKRVKKIDARLECDVHICSVFRVLLFSELHQDGL